MGTLSQDRSATPSSRLSLARSAPQHTLRPSLTPRSLMSPLKLSAMPSLPQLLLPPALLPLDMPASPLDMLDSLLDILDWQLEELLTELDLVPDMASQLEVLPMELSELLEFGRWWPWTHCRSTSCRRGSAIENC